MGDWLRGYRRGAAERCTGCRGVSPAPAFAGLYLPTRDAGAEERGRYAWMGYPARGAPVHPRPVPGPRFEIAFVFTIFRCCVWLLFSVCGSCFTVFEALQRILQDKLSLTADRLDRAQRCGLARASSKEF